MGALTIAKRQLRDEVLAACREMLAAEPPVHPSSRKLAARFPERDRRVLVYHRDALVAEGRLVLTPDGRHGPRAVKRDGRPMSAHGLDGRTPADREEIERRIAAVRAGIDPDLREKGA